MTIPLFGHIKNKSTTCRRRHQAVLRVYANQNCDAAMFTHISTECSSCQGKQKSRVFFHSFFPSLKALNINLSLTWKHHLSSKTQWSSKKIICVSCSNLYVTERRMFLFLVLLKWKHYFWGCNAFHGEPLSSCMQLIIIYDRSNMIG